MNLESIDIREFDPGHVHDPVFRQFFAISPELMLILDRDGSVRHLNPAWLAILGYSQQDIRLTPLLELVHPEDVPAAREILNNGCPWQASRILRMKTKAGPYRSIEWLAQKQDGWLYATGRDISESLRDKKNLEKLASRDALTGVYNRHHFDLVIVDLMDFADRYQEPLSCFLFDLDHFKDVNDTYGHQVGDRVLQKIVQVAGQSLRQSDLVFRFGGEEFLVLLPHTAIDGAAIAAEKLRMAIADTNFPIVGLQTVSIGVAEWIQAESLHHWLRRTDEALYQAKACGRDCVIDARELEESTFVTNLMEWQSEWNSGNRIIDRQHRELIQLANKLLKLYLTNSEPTVFLTQLSRLMEHIENHFQTEEQILREIGYPETAAHAKVHAKLVTKLVSLKAAYLNGEVKASVFFSFVVDDVVVEHMGKVDSTYFDWTRKEQGE